MFERMEFDEIFYEGVVEPSYKKTTRSDANRDVQRKQMIGESAL